MSDTPIVPPVPPPPAPIEIAAAEQVTAERAARVAAEQRATALEQELAAARVQAAKGAPAAVPVTAAVDPFIEELRQQRTEDRNDRRISHVRQLGYTGPLDNEDLLKLVPDVDPRTPAGVAAFEAWRAKNVKQFTSPGVTSAETMEALKPKLGELQKKSGLFSTDALIGNLIHGKGRNR